MAYADLVAKAKTYFPSFQVKYKDQDAFMQILGKLLFFAPRFMTFYTTTIGNTVYFPSEQIVNGNSTEFSGVLIHECTHMYDNKRLGPLFSLGYLFPQILALPILLLLFVLSWKIVLPLVLLSLLPWPAYWRAHLERRAYFVHMYAISQLEQVDPAIDANSFSSHFRDGSYYWMWPFEKAETFLEEAVWIKAGKPSCASEPALLQQVNDLIAAAKQ